MSVSWFFALGNCNFLPVRLYTRVVICNGAMGAFFLFTLIDIYRVSVFVRCQSQERRSDVLSKVDFYDLDVRTTTKLPERQFLVKLERLF